MTMFEFVMVVVSVVIVQQVIKWGITDKRK